MDWPVYVFGSGLAFFIGTGLILAGLAASFGTRRYWHWLTTIGTSIGMCLVATSAVPLSNWFYAPALTLTAAWLLAQPFRARVSPRWTGRLTGLVAIVWISGALIELPHHALPTIPKADARRLYLFGDSLSAGLDTDRSKNWPGLVTGAHDIELVDYSVAGATVATALEQAKDAPLGEGIVLLEIGGNDMLGATPDETFARNLDGLLGHVCQPGRQIVMFELPLLPLRNEFGRIQRRLAAKYHVSLIPKRMLIGVIAAKGATLDSIHLSPSGHRQLAEAVWQSLASAYGQ